MGAFLAIVASVVTVIGNVYAKEWALKTGIGLFLLTQLFYLAGAIAFPFALRYGTLTIITAIAAIATSVATTAIGLWYYHEQLATLHIVGLVLSLVAVILLTIPFKV